MIHQQILFFDADGADFKFKDGGTEVLRISNSSSDVIIKPTVDAKDISFFNNMMQQKLQELKMEFNLM